MLVGRDRLLERLGGLIGQVVAGEGVTVLVAGQAGIGKTSLLQAALAPAAVAGVQIGWGTCLDVEGAPGYWPWTQALDRLARGAVAAAGDDIGVLGSLLPSFGDGGVAVDASSRARLLLMDATNRFLENLASERPVVVVLDDLQWADESSLALLDFVARAPQPPGLGLIGIYRGDELPAKARRLVAGLVSRAEHVEVGALDPVAVHRLVERIAGRDVDGATSAAIHRRSGGHPFFVRELALLAQHDDVAAGGVVPAAVRDAIDRRLEQLPPMTRSVLDVTAVLGTGLLGDVVASVLGVSTVDVGEAVVAAIDAGVLARQGEVVGFAHDLFRETMLDRLGPARRIELHRAIGSSLEDRHHRGGEVAPTELARHFVAAVTLDGPDRAIHWALEAAAASVDSLAFAEAAGQLRRLRAAIADAGVDIDDGRLVDVLLAEADALAREGSVVDARGLLRFARDVADRLGLPAAIARVALATAQLGARFAARRDDIVRELDRALSAVAGVDATWEARLSATLARALQHSVVEDRPRAGPLSQRALELGRQAGDPGTLLACLLARHDVVWTPGTGVERAEVAREIVRVAVAAADDERHTEGLLLLANALLEQGSPAFEAALESCLAAVKGHGQPQHRYLVETRRAAVALLRGSLDEADGLIESAAALGSRIREPDTDNVRMSQRLELVRSRGQADELLAFASDAVRHWTGAPVHAHAVAAGFAARAGDLDTARRHVAAVVDHGGWRADRSYLWSVFVRELGFAAAALDDLVLCGELLDDLRSLADAGACGVNGAVVAFAGSHAHTAGLLAGALGQSDASERWLASAASTYRRLGAAGWLADVGVVGVDGPSASMRRRGAVWHVAFGGGEATVAHTKGLADIARLLAAPGVDIHVLDLIDAGDRSAGRADDVVDRRALDAYRRRLADLDGLLDEAAADNDDERRARLAVERDALLDELARVTRADGHQPRQYANHPAERARKAVTGRVRDAIRKLDPVLPELAAHLEQSIVTGTYCRYRAVDVTWVVDTGTG